MKKKFWLHVLAIALACSAVCFAGCKNGDGSDNTGDSGEHVTHTYVKVDRVESTCATHGTEEHYTCSGCESIFVKDGEEYVETTLSNLELPLGAHDFNGITLNATYALTDYTAFDEFDLTGLKVTKTCSVSGCTGELAADSEITFTYEKSGATCLTADMTKVIITVGEFSKDLAVTVNKKTITLPTITAKEYTGATLVADVPASELYTVTTNAGGTLPGDYDVVITLKDTVNYAFEGVEGETATLKFTVLKQSNTIVMPSSIADVLCYHEPVLTVTVNEDPDLTYVYSDAEDGEYAPVADYGKGLQAGTWFVKVIAAETAGYSETTSAPASFEVVHGFGGYKVGETEDTPVCACGQDVEGDSFKTVVSGTQYVLATAEGFATDMAKLKLTGVPADKIATYGNFACGELDLGSKTTPNVANVATLIAGTHGDKTLTLSVTDTDGYAHVIKIPVALVTEYIDDWATLLYKTQMNTANITTSGEGENVTYECLFGAGKYYVLSKDIVGGATNEYDYNGATYKAKDYANWGYESGSIDKIKGFGGTIDGAGHTISGVEVRYCGMFASLNGATLKNMVVSVDAWGNGSGLFAIHTANTTIENIDVVVNGAVDFNQWNSGVLVTQFMYASTINNVNVYAPGSDVKYLIAQGAWSRPSAGTDNSYSNINLYADTMGAIVNVDTELPTITFTKTETDTRKNQYVELTSSSAEFVVPSTFAGYAITEVIINGTVIGNSASMSASTILELLNSKIGEYPARITLTKDNHVVRLPITVAVVTEVITSWDQLLYRVGWRSGVDAEFNKGEYFVLGNDITGKNPEDGFKYESDTAVKLQPASSATGKATLADWAIAGGFAGTLDGAGYTISGIAFCSVSMFGALNGGTVKNLNMQGTLYDWARSIFSGAGHMDRATIENVTVTFSDASYKDFTCTATRTNPMAAIFAENQMTRSTLKNVTIHAEGIKFKNIMSQGTTGGIINTSAVNSNKVSNVKIYCEDYQAINFYTLENGKGDMSIGSTGEGSALMVYTSVQTVDLSKETFSLKIPTAITNMGYSCYRVRIGGKDSMLLSETIATDAEGFATANTLKVEPLYYTAFDFSNISSQDVKDLIGDNYGEYEITFDIADPSWKTWGGYGYVLRVNFVAPDSTVGE